MLWDRFLPPASQQVCRHAPQRAPTLCPLIPCNGEHAVSGFNRLCTDSETLGSRFVQLFEMRDCLIGQWVSSMGSGAWLQPSTKMLQREYCNTLWKTRHLLFCAHVHVFVRQHWLETQQCSPCDTRDCYMRSQDQPQAWGSPDVGTAGTHIRKVFWNGWGIDHSLPLCLMFNTETAPHSSLFLKEATMIKCSH